MKLKANPSRLAKPGAVLSGESWRDGKASAAARGYGHAWRVARLEFLAEHPLCHYCHDAGRISEATVVDHVLPHRGNQRLFWDRSNWQPLCKPCHDGHKARLEHAHGMR